MTMRRTTPSFGRKMVSMTCPLHTMWFHPSKGLALMAQYIDGPLLKAQRAAFSARAK